MQTQSMMLPVQRQHKGSENGGRMQPPSSTLGYQDHASAKLKE